ncbi:MAG: glycosyl hydrolase-related protein [Thermotogota bacterium]|nr:glycosyl hydrolase-related protein [Thermotogota bacterium]
MEERYNKIKEIFESTLNDVLDKLGKILPFGYACLNLNPQEIPALFENKEILYRFSAPSGSLSKVNLKKYKVSYLEKPINNFHWENEHFKAFVENGVVKIKKENNDYLIKPVLVEDKGDEYSSAFDKELNLTFSGMRFKARSDNYSKIALDFTSKEVDFTLYLTFSELPYINIEIESLGKGSDYGLLLSLIGGGDITSGAPFDSVKRPYEIKYEEPEEEMKKFLVAAREIYFNNVFPMRDYVGLEKDDYFAAFMAKGIYSYTTHSTTSLTSFGAFSTEKAVSLILLRSVSWLSLENVKGRIGDAGPVMYTPGAEVKRKMKIETAFCLSPKDNFLKYKNSFINPPLLFYKHSNNSGSEDQPAVVHQLYSSVDENIEFVNMKSSIDKEGITLRFFNPTHKKKEIKLPHKTIKTDLIENELEEFDGTIKPKEILTLKIPKLSFNTFSDDQGSKVTIVFPGFGWDISEDLSKPDIDIINNMEKEAVDLKEQIKDLEKKIKETQGINRYELLFEKYKLMRKALELELSSLYNRSKIERVDPSKIEHIIVELNDVRIKRRGIEFLLATLK